jgi:glycerol-3-phosphate dehydrogenase
LARKLRAGQKNQQVLDNVPGETQAAQIASFASDFRQAARLRLLGRFGAEALQVVTECLPEEKERIGESPALWSELRWAARTEAVVHLDDLLLRRVRIGLTLPQGGLPLLDRIRLIVQPELRWDDLRWQNEVNRYTQLWNQCYYLP